jgi:hypothetical protein
MRTVGITLILLSVLIPTLPPLLFGDVGFIALPLGFLTIPGCLIGLFMAFDRNGRWFFRLKCRRLTFAKFIKATQRKSE